ncbi:MAG: hypothetical protein P1U68_14230 [Verrucomicrobiales bacterium]|nr:hypothetical protein [Verrucomicrobiales bacterium]
MVIPRHCVAFVATRALSAFGVMAFFCQCTTTTTTTRKSTIKFDEGMWGGQGGNDSGEIRSKFAEKGYSIGEDGSIVADKPNLFAGDKAKGLDGKFGKKEAKFKNDVARTKKFRTPEYIKRQEFAGTDAARESGSAAREGNSRTSSDRQAGKLFQKAKTKNSNQLASFDTGNAPGVDKRFSTSSDARGSEGIANAPIPDGVRQSSGYKANAGMSVDDVKKLLSPGGYAARKGL